MMNDAEALKLAIRGREEGFRAIFANHGAFLFTHALRILKDHHSAEDAVQETFAAAFRSISNFRGESRLRTWLYQILYHNALRLAGKKLPAPGLVEDAVAAESEAKGIDLKNDVEATLNRLSERDRAILIMTYWDEMPLREAAQLLEINENNAKIILFRARNRFASLWSEGATDGKDRENHEM